MTGNGNIYQTILVDPILSMAFKYIVGRNTSNYAPYHHFHHMMCVTKWSMILADDGNIKEHTAEWYELMLACMFHDMNHSMGQLPDSSNVENAINEYAEFDRAHIMFRSDYPISLDNVSNIIKATQYPYVILDDDLNHPQEIIRDADLLVSLEPDWFQNAFLGLMNEMGVSDIKKMISGQMAFHKSIKMRTPIGHKLYETKWPSQCFNIISLLNTLYEKD